MGLHLGQCQLPLRRRVFQFNFFTGRFMRFFLVGPMRGGKFSLMLLLFALNFEHDFVEMFPILLDILQPLRLLVPRQLIPRGDASLSVLFHLRDFSQSVNSRGIVGILLTASDRHRSPFLRPRS